MVHETLITALAVAQKRDAEARARLDDKDDFKRRFRLTFGKQPPPEDEGGREDGRDYPPERLPDNASVDDAPQKPRKPAIRKTKRKGRGK